MVIEAAGVGHMFEELSSSEVEWDLGRRGLVAGASMTRGEVRDVDLQARVVAAAAIATLIGYLLVVGFLARQLGAPRAPEVVVLVLEATHLDEIEVEGCLHL